MHSLETAVAPAAWSWWLFGFGWRQPQIVVLDHGLYVDLPEELRQNYCALWCSFLVNDRQTATLVSQRIAGLPPLGTIALWPISNSYTVAPVPLSLTRSKPLSLMIPSGVCLQIGSSRCRGPWPVVRRRKVHSSIDYASPLFSCFTAPCCVAGERGGKLLPTLLKPGELRSHEQRKEFRREAGV